MSILKKNIEPILFLTTYVLCSILFSLMTNSSYCASAFYSDITILTMWLIPYALIKRNYRFLYIIISSFIISGNLAFQYSYYHYFKTFYGLTLSSSLQGLLFDIFTTTSLLFFIPIIVLILNKKFIQKEDSQYISAYVFILFFISFFLTATNITDIDIGRFRKEWNKEHIIDKFGIHLYTFNDLLWNVPSQISARFKDPNALATVEKYFEGLEINLSENDYTGIFEGKNLIVIHAESLQTLPLFMTLDNGNEVTPNLNRIIKDSLYFSNFYAQESLGTSSDTEFTFNTSLLPSKKGSVAMNYWDNNFLALPELLMNQGYTTTSMHANSGNFWNRRFFHQSLGFQNFYHGSNDYILDEIIGLGLSDTSFFKQSVEKISALASNNQPYMTTLITLSSHSPFKNIIPYTTFDASQYEGKAFGNYLKSINYIDEAIGQFFDDLETKGLLDNTVVVIYGDHDAQLRRKTYHPYYESNPEDLYYLDGLFDETMTYQLNKKVPLIIYSKDIEGKEIKDVCGIYDVFPTLANMFNLKTSYYLGRDVFSNSEPFVVLPNGSWITNEVYYYKKKNTIYYLKETFYSDKLLEYYHNKAKEILNISNKIIENDLISDG